MTSRRPLAAVAAALTACGLLGFASVAAAAPVEQGQLPGLSPKIAWDGVQASGTNTYAKPTALKAKSTNGLAPASTASWSATPAVTMPAACVARTGSAAVSGSAISFTPDLACNGPYKVTLQAKGGAPLNQVSNQLTATIGLAVPGAAIPTPQGVDAGNRTVDLGWQQQAYPDLAGYRIER
ncbi:MAG TPA: hypothetical protein VGM93_15695, partial [Acidimicrobiales bacterium]